MLREELQLLQEQGSYVGEVVKPMDKKKVLVKVKRSCNYKVLFTLICFSFQDTICKTGIFASDKNQSC